jgi:TonB family protein
MNWEHQGRSFLCLAGSLVLHGLVGALFLGAPSVAPQRKSPVDLEVVRVVRTPPLMPSPAVEEARETEPAEEIKKPEPSLSKPRVDKAPRIAERTPEAPSTKPPTDAAHEVSFPALSDAPVEEPVDKEQPRARPVFDLGDNTFAQHGGQEANWALARSEGNTKFAQVARPGEESVRGTAPERSRGQPGVGSGEGARSWTPMKDLTRKPEPVGGGLVLPAYPRLAKENNVEGTVSLQLFIDETGVVRRVRVIKDPGFGTAEAAEEQALLQRFTPALDKRGRPVSTVIVVSYRFVLED